jgi:hypothetical protein
MGVWELRCIRKLLRLYLNVGVSQRLGPHRRGGAITVTAPARQVPP